MKPKLDPLDDVILVDNSKKTDPASIIRDEMDEQETLDRVKTINIEDLDPTLLKPVNKQTARVAPVFDGYPLAPKVLISEYEERGEKKKLEVSATFIVGLDPKSEPVQDISGRGVYKTYHSRMIHHPIMDENIDVVFDREVSMRGSIIHIAVVPDHYIRSQLFFYYDSKKERIETDPRYLLFDPNQQKRLSRLYQQIINPKLKLEKQADMIADTESDESLLLAISTGD